MSMTIDQGTKVTMNFSLALENGDLIDSNFDAKPATFIAVSYTHLTLPTTPYV